ncbi:hypothetical protein AOLI_G00155110 [Acnodon oligacanthus]
MLSNFPTIRSDFVKELQLIERHQKVDLFNAQVLNRTMSQISIQVETSASSSLCCLEEKKRLHHLKIQVLLNLSDR